MKSILPALALLSFGSFAFADSEQVAYQSSSDATWYVGGSVGHLSNREGTLYTLQLGANVARSGPLTHSLFAEIGYCEFDETYTIHYTSPWTSGSWRTTYDSEFIPVTLNYKLDYQMGGRFSLYAGFGAGAVWMNDSSYGVASSREDYSIEFMAQAFAGVSYEVCSSFQLYAGDRYIWVDDSDRYFTSDYTGDDVALEIGARFRF